MQALQLFECTALRAKLTLAACAANRKKPKISEGAGLKKIREAKQSCIAYMPMACETCTTWQSVVTKAYKMPKEKAEKVNTCIHTAIYEQVPALPELVLCLASKREGNTKQGYINQLNAQLQEFEAVAKDRQQSLALAIAATALCLWEDM